MITSKTARTFKLHYNREKGYIVLEAQEYPWCWCQVVNTTPENREQVRAAIAKRFAPIAEHDIDKSFFAFQIGGGNYDGHHPERTLDINQNNYLQICEAIEDTVAQAAAWYYANVVSLGKSYIATPLKTNKQ